jgi:four helix bundle protein
MADVSDLIVELAPEFSVEIIKYTEELEKVKKPHLTKQPFRSGTLHGANVNKGQCCESRSDFIHEIKVAAKKAEETKYGLTLWHKADFYQEPTGLIEKLQIIIKILNKIIVTSKQVKTQ